MPLLSGHPTQALRFLIVDSERPIPKETLLSYLAALSPVRKWVLGSPQLLNGVSHPEGLESEDGSGFMGVEIKVYSALPPWKDRLPKDVDETHYQEATDLINSAVEFSRVNQCDLDFFLDNVFIGQIHQGKPDKLLLHGLLGEWRKMLDSR